MEQELRTKLRQQQYILAGEHSGVKLCHWMRKSLTEGRVCYKQQFYGIRTHRCLQMTPVVNHCDQNCIHCWRYQGQTEQDLSKVDEPELILDECIKGQRVLLSGYKGNPKCDLGLWKEAQEPNQVAISLTGEPTMYPRLGEFIAVCKRRNMTTFLVTNGTMPEVLEKLDPLPTQLYVSVTAPTKEEYKKLCRPLIDDGWERLQRTLELLPSLNTRTVIRHTIIKGLNMSGPKAFSKLDRMADPMFIEPKAFVLVGYSRKRLTLENMPSHDEVVAFTNSLNEELGLDFCSEKKDSRVTLLAKDRKDMTIPGLS